jgi:hypothetical protein
MSRKSLTIKSDKGYPVTLDSSNYTQTSMTNEQIKARENHELKSLRERIKVLEAHLAQETNHRALCESLLAEAIRHQYLDLEKCPPYVA